MMNRDVSLQQKCGLWWLVYLFLFSSLFSLVLLYRATGESSAVRFLTSGLGVLCVTLVFAAVVSGTIILQRFIQRWAEGPRYVIKKSLLYLLPPLLLLSVTELTIRLRSVDTPWGTYFRQVLLYPRDWDATVLQNQKILERMEHEQSYMVIDNLLGWTVGPNRRSADGLFYSSYEGIRSSGLGISFAETHPRHRIALVGDSMTFDEEVKFEDSWGYQLDERLGPEWQVLNFGVPGFGIDQMYLRYKRDVRSWHPDIVILGFINHDIMRTLWVYPFIGRPTWELPTMKPRFVYEEQLRLLNVPLPPPETIFAAHSVQQLPFIEHDVHYSPLEWERPGWRYLCLSYTFRALASLSNPWTGVKVDLKHAGQEELSGVNGELLRAFVELVREDGAVPIVIYLPTATDYMTPPPHAVNGIQPGVKLLQNYQIEHVDLTSCVGEVDKKKRFSRGEFAGHYSPATNKVVAECLAPLVQHDGAAA